MSEETEQSEREKENHGVKQEAWMKKRKRDRSEGASQSEYNASN